MPSGINLSSIMASLPHWELWGYVAAGAVAIGVIGESIHEFTSWFRRYSWWANKGSKASALLLIIALVVEVVIQVKANGISGQIIAFLSNQSAEATLKAAEATLKAGNLGVTVNNLHSFVEQNERIADDQMKAFKQFAADQKVQSDAEIATLKTYQMKLAATLATVKKDEVELTASVNTISELRQKLHDLTTKRVLTEQQAKELTNAVAPFAKVTFDMASTRDSDSPYFAQQIGLALQKAGWEWASRVDLGSLVFQGLPTLGSNVSQGLQVDLCRSEESSLAAAINAVYMALLADGFEMTHNIFADNEASSRNEPCGRIHFIVGSRL